MTQEITLEFAIEIVKDHIKIGRDMVRLKEILPEGYIIPDCLQIVVNEVESLQNENSQILGVMHSVDKWLDGDELKQDEVNRAATMREKVLRIIERLQAENITLKAERDAAVGLIAKLIMLCEVPQKDCDKVFRRLHIGAGDYMGSGYAFIDAYNRILNEFLETVNEDFYKLIRCEIDLRGVKTKESIEK